MANKDDDFNFKWDDDASFDSELDNFGGDVNEYHPDELKDAKKDRNPVISKLKSIAPTIHDAGSAVLAGAGKQIGRSIEDNVPEVYQTYTNATYVLSEAEMLRNQVTDKVKPWWNDTKRTLRKLSQQLEGQMPFGLDKKILKLVGEEERDQQYKQPSKEDMRREQMNSNINDIFELQMQKSMEQQKDNILNRTLDRRVANIHHKENAGFLSKIAENAVFQHAFTSSVFTAYLKKDLELKYKHFYIAEDTLEVFKNHARAVDNKLDAVIKNTALPEADKIYMRERISTGLKNKLADTFNNKLQNYFGEVSKKILKHVNEGLDLGKILTDALESQVGMLEIMNDPEMAAMGGMGSEPSLFSKKGLMHLALGNIGGFFAKRALKPLWNKVPQETQELLRQYFRKGRNGLALLMDDLRSGRIKGVPDELKALLQAITPKLNDKLDKGFVLNEGFQTLDQGAKFTTKFVKTVEDIIPGYLAMQTRYLEMMATNKDSGIQTWNFKTMSFENEKDRWARTRERIDVSNDAGGYRLKTAVVETRKMLEHKAQRYGATGDLIMNRVKKSLQTYHPEIELFIVNLAYSDEYYQVKPDEFVKELDAIVKAESMDDLAKMPLYRIGFEDIEHVKQVAGFWLDMLADRSRDGKTEVMPDKAAIVSFNNRLLDERSNITRSYSEIAEEELKQGNFDVLRALGAKVDSKGNFVYDLRALRRNEFKTTNKININEDISKEEIEKYNETFQYREWNNANDKNALLERLKNFLGNVKNMDPRDLVNHGKGMFAWFWKKFKGENKEKEMEKAWEKVLRGVDVTKDFLVNAYNDATNTLEGWYKQLHIGSVRELLNILADTDSANAKAWHLLRDMLIVKNAEGKNEIRDLSDLDAAEWYDWFSHLGNPSSAAEQFNKGTPVSNILLTVFPLDIKALIFAINNDPDLVKKMTQVNNQFNNNDPETIRKRQAELKKLATEAIETTKNKIESRSTAYATMTGAGMSEQAKDLAKDIAHHVKRAKEERAHEMDQISTTGFNGTVDHSYAQQQIDLLRHMDAVLGDFYNAFISDDFRKAERKRMKETYDSVKGEGEYQHDSIVSKEDKLEFYFNRLNDLYAERSAAKVGNDKTAETAATTKIVTMMKKIYGDKVNPENLHDYVVQFNSEYNELKNRDDYVADTRSKIKRNEIKERKNIVEFNPYTGHVEKLSDADAKKYKWVAGKDTALINELATKSGERFKFDDSRKRKEQRNLYIKRARKAYITLLHDTPEKNIISSLPEEMRSEECITKLFMDIRELILAYHKTYGDEFIENVNFYVPLGKIFDVLCTSYASIYTRTSSIRNLWIEAVTNLMNSAIDLTDSRYDEIIDINSLNDRSKSKTPLDWIGLFIKPVENISAFIASIKKTVKRIARRKKDDYYKENFVIYSLANASERDTKNELGVDEDDLLKLVNAKSDDEETGINKELSEKYKRDININRNVARIVSHHLTDLRNHNKAVINNIIDSTKNGYDTDATKYTTANIIDAIRDNFNTYEDINENGVDSLNNMLTSLLDQYRDEFGHHTTIEDVFRAITDKDYNDTINGTNKRKYASGGSYSLSRNRFRELAREYIGLTKLWDGKSMPDPAVLQKMQTGISKFEYSSDKDYVNFRPYFRRRVQLDTTKAMYDFLQRHPEYRDRHLESLVNNVCLCMRTASESQAQSPLNDADKLTLQGIAELFKKGPSAYPGRNAAHSIILYPDNCPLMLPVLYHELGHIVDRNANPLQPRVIKEMMGYGAIDPGMVGHAAKGARYEHHADWYGIRKTYELDNDPGKVHEYLRTLMKSVEEDKHHGDIYVKDSENAKPRIAIIGRGVDIGAYAYKIVRNDGTVDWIPLDDTFHISRAVYQIKDVYTGDTLANPIQVISIEDIRKTQKSMTQGGTVGLCAYSPDTNDYALATDDSDLKYRTNLMYRALRRYGMDPNKGRKDGKEPIKEMYAKGGNFDAADVIQNYTNKYNEISGITRSRYKDKASNSLIESTLAGKDYDDIIDLENEMSWDAGDDGQLQHAIDSAKMCDKLEYLLRKAPILDKTDYYRQWLNIPSTVHVAAIHLKEDTIKKHCPNLDAAFWSVLAEAKRNCTAMCAIKDPRYKNSGYIIRRLTASDKQYKALELFAIAHELGHIVTERGTIYGTGGDLAHSGRGHYTEKHADMYGLKRYLTDVGPTDLSHIINWLAWTASSSRGDDFAESKSNGSDGRWRSDLIRRYIRMRKHKGDPLYANFKDEYLQSKFRNKYANGDAISFDLPIDQYGGYVDQPTEILGGSGIAGEAGGETIIPHKYNERFKELIYRCLKDTVGENMARRVLRMMKPSDTTQDKLGINLPDASGSMMFAKGGFFKRWWNKLFSHDEEPDKKDQPESNEKRKKLEEELARIMEQLADADEDNASGPTADLFKRRDELEKELNGLDNPIKTEDKPKEEYTQRHEPTSIRNILLNIMESNEAIYRKMGDGLLVVDLASMLDKLKNTELLNKLKSLKIGERIKNFIFGAYGTGKGLVHGAYNIGKGIVKTAAMNVGSFGRHMFTNKVCDVYLKSKIEGEKHGELKISASELEHGAIFADEGCTKPIYSVADIHPPVYRKVNKNGTETAEKAINEEEAKDGLVDVEGNSLLRFGGKIGRFLRHVATTPLKAILTHKNWERLKGLGSSIMSGIGSGVNGLLDAYCDVYTTNKLEKPLVRGESIKEGRLVRVLEGGKIKVVPTVFDIDGPCWLLVDDETNPGERKLGNNEVITETDITDGLCHKDGSPIESTKIAKAAAMLRRAIGAVGNGIASLTGGAFGIGATVIGWAWNKGKAAAGWVKDRVKDAFTAKDPYIDVCIIKNGKLEVVITGEDLKTNKATLKYCFRDDKGEYKPVLSAYGIDSPVYTMVGEDGKTLEQPRCVIKQEDLDVGVFDTAGNKLTKWAGRSLAGKIGTAALGAVKVGWKALKGLGKGLWNVGKTVLGGIGTLLGEGGATITGFFTKAWSSTLDFFKNSVISRKDLQEIVGDRLLDIYGLLYKYMPRRKYVEGVDKNNDGNVDGSWEDYEQKRKEREAKREQEQSGQSDNDNTNSGEHGESFWSKIKEAFLSGFDGGGSSTGFLDWVLGGLGLKSFFTGKGAGAAAATNVARAATVTEAAMSGKKGLFGRFINAIKGLFDRPTAKNGFKRGKLYSAKKWLSELFFGDPYTGKPNIINRVKGFFHKRGATAAGEAAASSAAKTGKMATAWNWFKGLFGKGAASGVAGATAGRGAAAAGGVAAKAAGEAAAKGVLGRIGARLAAGTAANLSGPVIGQIISAGMYLWTGYEIIKYFVTDSSKVKGLRPVRFKAYGVSPKYWEAIEDLETDTFSEFKAGHAEGVPVDRLKKFGYKIDFLDASEMAYGGDKLEYIKTWYRFKFVPFYQKYAQSIIIACKLDPNSQPKGDDIPDEVYSTIILQLTKGFDRINVGPLKELKLDKVSYEKWLAKKREKDREEGLESGKYNNKDLADDTLTGAASKLVGNVSDHLGYAWNEFKHGNILNAIGAVGKAHRAAAVKLVAYVAQVVGGFVPGLFMGLFHNEKSTNEKAWDEVRFKLYGLDKAHVSKREYERISKLIKDFEIHQIHVIDGEEKMVEEDLRDLAEEIFTERVRKNIKSRLSTSGLSTIATSKDLYPESTGFVVSWYKRIFLPIFTLYANAVRAACGDKPGDNIVIDSIPADQRADLLKEFERQAKAMLAKNIDTEVLRLSPDGFFDYLAMRSEEDIAEFAKDSKDLVSEDELGFGAKLSRNLDDAGNDLAKAWSLKFKDPGKALGLAIKGVGKAIWGTFKTVGKSIGQSVADFLHGSANEHRWETRFFDYGFTSRSGSSDVFKNQNLRAMEEFEAEAGKQLLEDNTGKPDEQFFVRIALNSGFIEDCCQKVFGSGSGIDDGTLSATNTRTFKSAILKYSTPIGWIDTLSSKFTNKVFGINTLSELKEKLVNYLVGNVKDNVDPNRAKLNIKAKIGDIINYLDFWWTVRFKPVFDTFIGVINGYGVEPDDIDVDNIPEESRKQAYDEYKKEVAAVLKKDNVLVYNLSAAGCAAYLKQLDEYRKDAKDGVINDARNPLAKYYKEKEEEFENTVVAAVVANAPALDKEEKFRVAKSLAKASMEIDSELNDVNTMAKYAAKDILAKLGVIDLIHPSRSVKDTIYSILLRLTIGGNYYDTIIENPRALGWAKTLGEVFVDFLEDAHECLYGTDEDNLDKYLKKFAELCTQSNLFIIKYKGVDILLRGYASLNAWVKTVYKNLGIDDAASVYFGNWFAYRFMPYYAYFVTLVNKANGEKDLKKFPDISKLSVMRRNYIIDKLAKSEHKGLISFKAKSMKIDGNSFDAYFRKLNETEGNAKAIGHELRSNGRKFLEERLKSLEKQLAEDREKRKVANQSKEDVKRYVEDKNLADVDVLSTGRPGALIGGKNTKQKGRSCTEEERRYIYNFLTSELSLTPEQAAAVMGNMMAESTMSPTAINKDGGGDGAHGLFQWRGPRLKGGGVYTGLIPFAKALGLDPYSVEAQMKYFKHEIETVPYERSQFNKFVRSIVTDPRNPNKTIAQAAVGFRKGFERCGDYETRDSERVGYAKDFYRKYGPGKVPSYLPNTSVLDTAKADNTGTTGAVTNTPPVATSQSTNVQADIDTAPAKADNTGTTGAVTNTPPVATSQSTNVQADIDTAPANTTSSVGVSGSKQPIYSGSYGNVSDQTKKACDYVTAHSHARSLGKCARYVANALQAAGYKFNRQPSAYMYHTNGILTKMGFMCMGGINTRPQAGDVCVINRFKGHPHGHICMYNGQQWISDFRQRTASPYKAGAPGGIWYYRPNGSTASSTNNATTNIVSNVNSDIVKNNQIVYEHAVSKVRNNSAVEQVKPTPASVISNTSTEGTNDNIRTLSAMQTDITNANSGNAPIVSELKLISSILSAFKGDVSGFIHMLTNTTGLTKAGDTTKATTTVTNNKSISDEGLRILVDKLNKLAQLITTTTNPNVARTSPKYHARDDYMQGYPLQTNKVSS